LAEADLLKIDAEIFDRAGALEPPSLRSLDALHLAAAMALGPDLAGIVAYDDRLIAAAVELGLPVASPS
jgi:predicted nucleic acid-binding protein